MIDGFAFYLFIFINCFTLLLCSPKKNLQVSFTSTPKTESQSLIPISEDLTELSFLLSGKITSQTNSKYSHFINSSTYSFFQTKLKSYWKNYSNQILIPLQSWKEFQVPYPKSKVALYPFSGPDFPNVYTLYPEVDKYILIGLEASGKVPKLNSMNSDQIKRGFKELLESLANVSKLNYFMTNSMKKNVSASVFQGTTPIFLTYFGLLGLKPCSIKPIDLNKNGEIFYLTEKDISQNERYKKGFYSLEIIFYDPLQNKNKTLYFFSKDVANFSLQKNPELIDFIKRQGMFVSTFKAASFLPHYPTFSIIRNLIVENSETIVMDDTGPPIKNLKDKFNIRVFGKYTRPISLWPEMYQPELAKLHKEQNPSPINFKYGYGTLHNTHHILIATRKN